MSQVAIIGVLGLLLCSSSSGAAALMMGGEMMKVSSPALVPSTQHLPLQPHLSSLMFHKSSGRVLIHGVRITEDVI
jgi:hypothetical protein